MGTAALPTGPRLKPPHRRIIDHDPEPAKQLANLVDVEREIGRVDAFEKALGPHPMNLVFSNAEVMAIALTAIVTGQVTGDGESNWLEGVQLLAVYIIFGLVFYFLPEAPQH